MAKPRQRDRGSILVARNACIQHQELAFQVEIIPLSFHAPQVVLLVSNLNFQILYFPLVIATQALACGLDAHGSNDR